MESVDTTGGGVQAADPSHGESLRDTGPPQAAGGETREQAALREIAARRAGGGASGPLDLRGLRLHRVDLKGVDLARADLSGADLFGADLAGVMLFGAKLAGAILQSANLEGAELTGADLSQANLREAKAARAGLGGARLEGAALFQADLRGATLTQAGLAGADLRCADLTGARARESDLEGADLTQACLRDCDLEHARVRGTRFDRADLRGSRLRGVRGYEKAAWIGADFRDVDFTGAWLLRRFAMDQNFIEEFKSRDRASLWAYRVWWLTSDCGRSVLRWTALTAIFAFLYAGLYGVVGIDFGRYETFLSPLYYSIVTLTTLGYGDVVPSTLGGQIVAMLEVITGYVMLGGLITIFSNKFGRRAD